MTLDAIHTALGLGLLIVQASLLIPLITGIARTRSSDGISPLGEAAWIAAGIGWIGYGIATDSMTLVISGALAAVGSTAVYVLIRPDVSSRQRKLSAGVLVAFTAVVLACMLTNNVALFAVVLASFGVVQFIPQLVVSARARSVRGQAPAFPLSVPLCGRCTPSPGQCTPRGGLSGALLQVRFNGLLHSGD